MAAGTFAPGAAATGAGPHGAMAQPARSAGTAHATRVAIPG